MNSSLAYKAAICEQYEILLKECETALEAWDERRDIRHWPHGIFGRTMAMRADVLYGFCVAGCG